MRDAGAPDLTTDPMTDPGRPTGPIVGPGSLPDQTTNPTTGPTTEAQTGHKEVTASTSDALKGPPRGGESQALSGSLRNK